MVRTLAASAGGALALLLAASSAQAQSANRAWVSGHGTDAAGCGAPTAPCRSLQYAHDHIVIGGGEIDILDPAGYGAITITKAISIINDGVGTAGVQAPVNHDAIDIAAASGDHIRLRGLDIEGLHQAFIGVGFVTGASLVIENSSINGFSYGLVFEPSGGASTLYVSRTRVANCDLEGIEILPGTASGSAKAVLERVEAIVDGQDGLLVDAHQSTASTPINVTLDDSVITGMTGGNGVHATHGPGNPSVVVIVRNTTLTNNVTAVVSDNSSVYVGHSTITGNVQAFAIVSGANLGSYGDNITDGNTLPGASPTPLPLH